MIDNTINNCCEAISANYLKTESHQNFFHLRPMRNGEITNVDGSGKVRLG